MQELNIVVGRVDNHIIARQYSAAKTKARPDLPIFKDFSRPVLRASIPYLQMDEHHWPDGLVDNKLVSARICPLGTARSGNPATSLGHQVHTYHTSLVVYLGNVPSCNREVHTYDVIVAPYQQGVLAVAAISTTLDRMQSSSLQPR
ncbi:hypothetical protein I7I51_00107 [Histoplasma capsulatum]|uniref:Uncharacterized protein n=1 Tax=Ajellomyces capsulatus TaxID=5037 RepID=A0A8A1MCX2_AJECA|nr:hypothetical protein I7I51_00107 [Histoplasma capsulatum]